MRLIDANNVIAFTNNGDDSTETHNQTATADQDENICVKADNEDEHSEEDDDVDILKIDGDFINIQDEDIMAPVFSADFTMPNSLENHLSSTDYRLEYKKQYNQMTISQLESGFNEVKELLIKHKREHILKLKNDVKYMKTPYIRSKINCIDLLMKNHNKVFCFYIKSVFV